MAKRLLSSLGAMVRNQRGKRTLREAAKEIGIGPATLMRVENGRTPDLSTFGKICKWVQVDPASFLDFDKPDQLHTTFESTTEPVQISAHFRADQTPRPETIHALSQMILLAIKKQGKAETTALDDDV